jgi:hypothetical protein
MHGLNSESTSPIYGHICRVAFARACACVDSWTTKMLCYPIHFQLGSLVALSKPKGRDSFLLFPTTRTIYMLSFTFCCLLAAICVVCMHAFFHRFLPISFCFSFKIHWRYLNI